MIEKFGALYSQNEQFIP